MSEKNTILAIHVHEDQGVEIEISLEKGNMNVITMIGLLEQLKFDMLKQQHDQSKEMRNSNYDA